MKKTIVPFLLGFACVGSGAANAALGDNASASSLQRTINNTRNSIGITNFDGSLNMSALTTPGSKMNTGGTEESAQVAAATGGNTTAATESTVDAAASLRNTINNARTKNFDGSLNVDALSVSAPKMNTSKAEIAKNAVSGLSMTAGGTSTKIETTADAPADTDTPTTTDNNNDNVRTNTTKTGADLSEIVKNSQKEQDLSSDRVKALRNNASELEANEQSTANKLLTGAAVGTMGVGLKMALQGSAEQAADKAAESDMKAYLESFRCDYGMGKNTMGGDTDVELPGMNALTTMFSEYATLASDLKARKESLGLAPGIESELIIDATNAGLFDDVSLGIKGGHYGSIARSILNPGGEDATKLASDAQESKTRKTAGIVLASVGAVGSLVGNAVINKNAPKNQADAINGVITGKTGIGNNNNVANNNKKNNTNNDIDDEDVLSSVTIPNTMWFEQNSTELTDAARRELATFVSEMKEKVPSDTQWCITIHSMQGSDESDGISEKRATVVYNEITGENKIVPGTNQKISKNISESAACLVKDKQCYNAGIVLRKNCTASVFENGKW